jgi:hypothetical protein
MLFAFAAFLIQIRFPAPKPQPYKNKKRMQSKIYTRRLLLTGLSLASYASALAKASAFSRRIVRHAAMLRQVRM